MLELLEIHTQDLILEVYGDEPQYVELQIAALPSGGGGGGSTTWGDILGKPTSFPANTFVYVQATPSPTWIINHNQGFKPTFVSVMDAGGSGVNCGITHPSVNQTVLSFNPPMAGVARLL